MYIHLGKDVSVSKKNITGIFDIDVTTTSKDTRAFLKKCEDDNIVTNVSEDLPKSFILCNYEGQSHLYVSAITTATLRKRSGLPIQSSLYARENTLENSGNFIKDSQ